MTKPGIKRQHIEFSLATQRLRQLTYIAFPREENQDIATFAVVSRINCLHQLHNLLAHALIAILHRIKIMRFNRIGAPGYFNYRRIGKVPGETLDVYSG